MTTFDDPRDPRALPPIHWDELKSDDERHEIATLFRSRYQELKSSRGKAFDATAEEARIPAGGARLGSDTRQGARSALHAPRLWGDDGLDGVAARGQGYRGRRLR